MADEAIKFFESVAEDVQLGTTTAAYEYRDQLAYQLSRVPFKTARPIKMIVAGAGISGLSMAHEVNTGSAMKSITLTIYEKNAGVGGTWYENRYPGCACDIPVHNYQFSWAPNPYFTSFYATSTEIRKYLDDVTDQHDLRKYIKLSHKVVGAKWIEERKKWQVAVQKLDSTSELTEKLETFIDECDVFITGTGWLNDWKWPSIPGRDIFEGEILHSARWPENHKFSQDQTVALIGNGSSGIQILPAILHQVKKVFVFMRTPTWVAAGYAEKYAGSGGSNIIFSEEQKKCWAENPEEYYKYRVDVEMELNSRFRMYLKNGKDQSFAKCAAIEQMSARMTNKPDLIDLLLPEYAVGCRRPTPGIGYLEALCSDKVEVVWGGIESFTETGIRTEAGLDIPVDSIICATGFNVTFAPRFPIVGQNNVDLQKKWTVNPQAYMSVTTSDMPNYFTYLGPGSPVGHGSMISSVELITKYIADLVRKLQTENYAAVCPKPELVETWQKQCFAWLDQTAWTTGCTSTFKNGDKNGRLVSLHGGSRQHFFQLMGTKRYEDFNWSSLCPAPEMTFAWLAGGFTITEAERIKTIAKGLEVKEDISWFFPPADPKSFIKPEPSVKT